MAKTIGPRKTWYSQKSIRAKRGERNQFLESHLSFSLFRWNLTYSLLKNQTFLILVFFLCPTRTCTHVSTANGKKAMWSNEMSVCARHVMLHSKTTLYEFRKRRRRRGKKILNLACLCIIRVCTYGMLGHVMESVWVIRSHAMYSYVLEYIPNRGNHNFFRFEKPLRFKENKILN